MASPPPRTAKGRTQMEKMAMVQSAKSLGLSATLGFCVNFSGSTLSLSSSSSPPKLQNMIGGCLLWSAGDMIRFISLSWITNATCEDWKSPAVVPWAVLFFAELPEYLGLAVSHPILSSIQVDFLHANLRVTCKTWAFQSWIHLVKFCVTGIIQAGKVLVDVGGKNSPAKQGKLKIK